MTRILVSASERRITRFLAETLYGQPLERVAARSSSELEVARAHSGLETFVLIHRGGRPFDALVIDVDVPDCHPLDLLGRVRSTQEGASLPIFVMSERGQDQHLRRIIAERFGLAGILEKPVDADSVRAVLRDVHRRLRVLLVEPDEDAAESTRMALLESNYHAETVPSGREALERAVRFEPDLVGVSLDLDGIRGHELAEAVKRWNSRVAVLLFGSVEGLRNAGSVEACHRADDFLLAPYSTDQFVQRVAARIGLGLDRTIPNVSENPLRFDSITPGAADRRHDLRGGSASQRSRPRVPFAAPIQVGWEGHTREAEGLDISEGGMFFSIDECLTVGIDVSMAFSLPTQSEVLTLVGRVAWVGPGRGGHHPFGVGVEFVSPPPPTREAVRQYCERLSSLVFLA